MTWRFSDLAIRRYDLTVARSDFVDVVLHECNLALRFHLNGTGQIAFGHRGRNVGDGAELRREVCGQPIDALAEEIP